MHDALALSWAAARHLNIAYLVVLLFFASIAVVLWLRLGKRIYARERNFLCDRPFPLVGRPDLIVQEWGGLLVIHDLKTRVSGKVYPSDTLQLSLYALLVRRATGRQVASFGYVRLLSKGKQQLAKVQLEGNVDVLVDLYQAFMQKADDPSTAQLSAPAYLCISCGFRGDPCPGKRQHITGRRSSL